MKTLNSSVRSDMFIDRTMSEAPSSFRSGTFATRLVCCDMPLLTELGKCVLRPPCYNHAAPNGAVAEARFGLEPFVYESWHS